MFSKTVLAAFVALCCAQAFVSAAPHDEKITSFSTLLRGNVSDCMEDLSQGLNLVNDGESLLKELVGDIFNVYFGLVECFPMAANDALACDLKVVGEAIQNLSTLAGKALTTLNADLPVINKIAADCFGLH